MKLSSTSFTDGQAIPGHLAFCIPDPAHHVCLGKNRNPQLSWSDVPPGTRSFVIICHDPDVPSSGDDVNQEGRKVPASLPRIDFYHWVLIDLNVTVNAINEAEFSNDVTPRGKSGPQAAHGSQQGINNYTDWFAGDHDMSGDYHGYDGPCPPWNDEIVHRYVFTVYALDIDNLPLSGKFGGPEVKAAMQGHILAEANITGTYTLNPALF
ncbi:MAG: YbhB/YbcL family Raf kinase inhibitor-like protein [Rhodocyclaceae bacterium]|nr:YbhB/YbcL family Raf kinase inhibitor-like protein [Rhodocyclaceae bacterium]